MSLSHLSTSHLKRCASFVIYTADQNAMATYHTTSDIKKAKYVTSMPSKINKSAHMCTYVAK